MRLYSDTVFSVTSVLVNYIFKMLKLYQNGRFHGALRHFQQYTLKLRTDGHINDDILVRMVSEWFLCVDVFYNCSTVLSETALIPSCHFR